MGQVRGALGAPTGRPRLNLLYRADGGHPIGTGHLFRAVRILRELESRGGLTATLASARNEAGLRIGSQAPARIVALSAPIDPAAVKPLLEAAPLMGLIRGAVATGTPYDLLVVDMLDTPDSEMKAL